MPCVIFETYLNKKLYIVYLKFKFSLAFCIFIGYIWQSYQKFSL